MVTYVAFTGVPVLGLTLACGPVKHMQVTHTACRLHSMRAPSNNMLHKSQLGETHSSGHQCEVYMCIYAHVFSLALALALQNHGSPAMQGGGAGGPM